MPSKFVIAKLFKLILFYLELAMFLYGIFNRPLKLSKT